MRKLTVLSTIYGMCLCVWIPPSSLYIHDWKLLPIHAYVCVCYHGHRRLTKRALHMMKHMFKVAHLHLSLSLSYNECAMYRHTQSDRESIFSKSINKNIWLWKRFFSVLFLFYNGLGHGVIMGTYVCAENAWENVWGDDIAKEPEKGNKQNHMTRYRIAHCSLITNIIIIALIKMMTFLLNL